MIIAKKNMQETEDTIFFQENDRFLQHDSSTG